MFRFELVLQNGHTVCRSNSLERLEKKQQQLLDWRCGICGMKWAGWRRCSHGSHNQVCSAEYYNSRIVENY